MNGESLRDGLGRRRPDRVRHYTDTEKAEAVGLALTVGDDVAAAQLGIPRRNLNRWRRSSTPAAQAAISRTRDDVAARLWEAVTAGTDAVLEGPRDPASRLGDKASALRIVVEAHALISGAATSRTEVITEERREANVMMENAAESLRAFTAASDEELRAFLATDDGIALLREIAEEEGHRVG